MILFIANSDDEDEPNERPVGNGGVKRPRNNTSEQSNKRFTEETRAFKVILLEKKSMKDFTKEIFR